MLLKDKTKEEFGYYPDELTKGSHKKVCTKCDYCGTELCVANKNRNKSNKDLDKDACKKCRYKKRDEIGILLHGCTNPFARPEVKEKIKDHYGGVWHTQTEEFKEKAAKTCKEKYGSESYMQSDVGKEYHKEVMQEKYGVDNASSLDWVKEKRKETCERLYGHEYFMASEEGKRKLEEGLEKKLGVKNAFQSDEVKQKIVEHNIKKYGTEHRLQNEEEKKKQEDTIEKKYGVRNIAQVPEFKEKAKQTNLSKYGYEYATQHPEVAAQIIKTKIDKGQMEVYEGKTKEQWSEEIKKPYTTFVLHVRKYGFEEAIQRPEYINGLENRFKVWFDKENIEYTFGKAIEGRKYDFLIGDNIVIEADGLFYHSDAILKDNYHVIKRQHYIDHGYIPLFFRSDEIENKFPIIKSIINNKLGRTTKIGARKCTVEPINSTFFDENHLMGKGQGKCIGLIYKGKVVAGIQMKRIKDGAEISRFSLAANYSVPGAFSRLLKRHPLFSLVNKIQTFIDLRYGQGDYLSSLGFKREGCHPSFRWTDGERSFHRMKFPGQSGYEHNLFKIWDCGQLKYIYRK